LWLKKVFIFVVSTFPIMSEIKVRLWRGLGMFLMLNNFGEKVWAGARMRLFPTDNLDCSALYNQRDRITPEDFITIW
jgi:hypothetical protein